MGPNNTLMGAMDGGEPIRVASTDSHHDAGRLVDSSSDRIVQTAPAMERIPMRLAPLLSIEMLNQVSTIVLRRDPGANGYGQSYQQAYKVRTFRTYHVLFMEFECHTGDVITIDRGAVYIVDQASGDRTYTCANNVECASFLAAGVNITELSDEADVALAQYRLELSDALIEVTDDDSDEFPERPMLSMPIADSVNGTNETNGTALLRRRLNFRGHMNADGTGLACKVTRRGRHKIIVGGDGTWYSPCMAPRLKLNCSCMIPLLERRCC